MESQDRSSPNPPPTVIIERKDRPGILRRIVWPLFLILLLLSLFGNLLTQQAGFPTKLPERYLAGDLAAAKVAVVEVSGTLLGSETEHVLRQIRQARDDSQVRAIILRIDSPGGGVSDADQIWREVAMLRKPVVVSMGGMAASGGYYIAAPADLVIAEPTTITGSIGVIWETPMVGELLKKLGVSMATVSAGEFKNSGSMFESELSPEARERWEKMTQSAYDRFVRIIASGRKLPLATARSVADGKLLTAEEALELKLVDRLGYLDDAIRESWNLARLESSRVIRYGRPLSLTQSLLSLSSRAGTGLPEGRELLQASVPRLLYLAR